MIPKIEKILYATDLSESARYAFGYAADLAGRYDAKIIILYVMEDINHTVEVQVSEMIGLDKWNEIKSQKQKGLKEKIKQRVSDFCQEMNSEYESCRLLVEDIRIEKGAPHDLILTLADEIDVDLIVMGTHGYNMIQDAFIGGTARTVVKKSEKPVMVIRLPKA